MCEKFSKIVFKKTDNLRQVGQYHYIERPIRKNDFALDSLFCLNESHNGLFFNNLLKNSLDNKLIIKIKNLKIISICNGFWS